MKLKFSTSNNRKRMSAQVTPLAPVEGGTANGNGSPALPTPSNDGSGDIPSSKKHVCSRFLKKRPPDLYGQRHAIESAKCVNDSLRLLEKEIRKLPYEKRAGVDRASMICPEMIESREHRLLFLRCEQFNVDLAAIRMAKYWNRRIELFGDAAFHPLSIATIRDRGERELSLGFLRVMPDTDGTGRCNVFIDPTVLEGHGYEDENMVRAAWYALHAAIEDESTQMKGVVFLVYLRHACVRHFDRSLVKAIANSIKGVLPVRVSVIHIFHPPYLFEVLFEVVSLLLGERLTKRMKMYSGEDSAIHDKLTDFGILPSRLPVELGGALDLDQDQWIAERESEGN
eukprot:CAMPEP_0172540764 /NCGR_PEP_ID=MMETSP1067-20121228/11699_1 /TAXON_ID=265564 ORGANISM="Thalassiosira punctigera, Strain Tpunct2005C2" /NCGR_SAMPLE_ID=MMETSP1067 /ASSEMBLY_ACC=CAM_ASM_000444 /LENGTH=340 /DNA_ID=CAMNT_0013326677 /DNA_START=60 /DNA_END=1082 /DNA_ORIENTATION=+